MNKYYFEQSYTDYLISQRKDTRSASILLCALFFVYLIAWLFEPGKGNIWVLTLVFLSALILLNRDGLKNQDSKAFQEEKWVIQLTESKFSWQSPAIMVRGSNEITFEIDVSEIIEVQRSYSEVDDNAPYLFLLQGERKLRPGINSSVNIDQIIETLQSLGVSFNRVSGFGR